MSFCIEGHIEYTWYCKDCDKVDQVVQDDVDEPMEAEDQSTEEPTEAHEQSVIAEVSALHDSELVEEEEEPSLLDEELPEEHTPPAEVTYQVIERGTQRGKPLLVDSLGYCALLLLIINYNNC